LIFSGDQRLPPIVAIADAVLIADIAIAAIAPAIAAIAPAIAAIAPAIAAIAAAIAAIAAAVAHLFDVELGLLGHPIYIYNVIQYNII
jgi:hypothetical protein